ncbi:TetR/AcrR family transcriptional regulator [Embleya sp. MST-111070]|uniref:TetR/AcrR family transcriptional regulator n=1 Tax=Embleya sp. MST-111070 TaxID=3398231 RepID=UPI003F733B55
MTQELGLRERKKMETRIALWRTAMRLFLERGFDNVSVAEIAAGANVSKMTVFNYFQAKEELVLGPMTAHVGEPAEVVRERGAGETPVDALRRHFLDALRERNPVAGLNDDPQILGVHRLILDTPSLRHGAMAVRERNEHLLAAEFERELARPGDLACRLAANQILNVRQILIARTIERLAAGASADEVYPVAVAEAEEAFTQLADGLGGFCTRDGVPSDRGEPRGM